MTFSSAVVLTVPCLTDNYAFIAFRQGCREAVVVDPSESEPIAATLRAHGLEAVALLNTHHHWDHVGGNRSLLDAGARRIYGHALERGRIPGQTQFLQQGTTFEEAGLRFEAEHVPGHTRGALAYVGEGFVFTGDTLFGAGCGRLFEGTAEELCHSLNERLASLPDDTEVYCGHEYTQKNLAFAALVEPENVEVRERQRRVADLRATARPTVPSKIREEKETNPFLRLDSAGIRAWAMRERGSMRERVEVFAALRAARDRF